MPSKQEAGGSGIGFFGLMFLIFMTLKLCGVIDWSWWWVAAPLWVPVSLALVTLGAVGGAYFVFFVAPEVMRNRRNAKKRARFQQKQSSAAKTDEP